MPKEDKHNLAPRIANRRALHDYFISAKLECGMALVGSEVKSLREGKAQLQDSFATIDHGQLMLHGCHIDPYTKAAIAYNHEPRRDRRLLAKKREIKKLEGELTVRGTTLIPLAIYFKDGLAKLELGVARGKQQHDKRDSIRKREQEREMRRATTQRR